MKQETKQTSIREKAAQFLRNNPTKMSEIEVKDVKSLVEELSIHQVELEIQNEELQRAQFEISELRDKYEDLYEFMPVGYFVIDQQKIIREVNLTACELFGRDRNVLKKSPFTHLIDPSSQDTFYVFFRNTFGSMLKQTCELNLRKADGSNFYAHLECSLITNTSDEQEFVRIALFDISSRKTAETQIKASLEEKETLLKEIHHRVKNNMQVVSSLLRLQMNSAVDQKTKEALNECQGRIHAMSEIHESLHNSENLNEINLHSYLTSLVKALYKISNVNPEQVTINIQTDKITMDIDKANYVGLVVNELVSNSFKHAFHGGREGTVKLSAKMIDNEFELSVVDNGVGIPDNLDWKNAKTLGLRLVTDLVEKQLNGSIELDNSHGSKFIIRISL